MKAINVNISSSKLKANRMIAKNEIIQNKVCSSIDGQIDKSNKIDFQSKRADQRKAYRKAQRLNKQIKQNIVFVRALTIK